MVWQGVRVLLVLLLCPPGVVGDTATERQRVVSLLTDLLRQHPVVLLGETHRRPESPRLVAEVARAYVENGGCLTVALEIAADQQPALHAGVHGTGALSAVVIHPIIDHPPYRAMLRRLQDLRRAGGCVRVHAIDAHREYAGAKDEWMATAVHGLLPHGATLVLVGNLHVLKRVRWQSGKDAPYAAERLTRNDIPVVSVLQEWEPQCDTRSGRLLGGQEPRARAALQATLDLLAIHPPEASATVIDYVVVWECADG
jgi:hypothetical protein